MKTITADMDKSEKTTLFGRYLIEIGDKNRTLQHRMSSTGIPTGPYTEWSEWIDDDQSDGKYILCTEDRGIEYRLKPLVTYYRCFKFEGEIITDPSIERFAEVDLWLVNMDRSVEFLFDYTHHEDPDDQALQDAEDLLIRNGRQIFGNFKRSNC